MVRICNECFLQHYSIISQYSYLFKTPKCIPSLHLNNVYTLVRILQSAYTSYNSTKVCTLFRISQSVYTPLEFHKVRILFRISQGAYTTYNSARYVHSLEFHKLRTPFRMSQVAYSP